MMPEISRSCGLFAAAAISLLLGPGPALEAQGPQAARPAPPKSTYWALRRRRVRRPHSSHPVRAATASTVERTTTIGELPNEMEGPHGLAISRDGKYPVHDHRPRPAGRQTLEVRARGGADTLVGERHLARLFPGVARRHARRALHALGQLQSARRHGAVHGVGRLHADRTEVARIVTCTMPHGSRIDPTGTRQYSTCMMDDQLVEIDTVKFEVARRFSLAKGKEGPLPSGGADAHAGHAMAGAACASQAAGRSGRSRLRRRAARDDAGDVLADLGAAVGRRQTRSSSRATRPTRSSRSIARRGRSRAGSRPAAASTTSR